MNKILAQVALNPFCWAVSVYPEVGTITTSEGSKICRHLKKVKYRRRRVSITCHNSYIQKES